MPLHRWDQLNILLYIVLSSPEIEVTYAQEVSTNLGFIPRKMQRLLVLRRFTDYETEGA
jgi:hypothetical protein